jgi:hypothetical protein
MLVKASSTARVTARQSAAENPNDSVNRSTAPRTAQSRLGSLCNSSLNRRLLLESPLRSLPLLRRTGWRNFMRNSISPPGLPRLRSKHRSLIDHFPPTLQKECGRIIPGTGSSRPMQRSSQGPKRRRQFRILTEGHSQQTRRTDAERRVLRPGLSFA